MPLHGQVVLDGPCEILVGAGRVAGDDLAG
jgi:hypothetical protein